MQREIQDVVQKVIQDAFPAAWLLQLQRADSVLLSVPQEDTIFGWLKGPHKGGVPKKCQAKELLGTELKLDLLYRASRDGWAAQNFHSKCDNQGATVSVIRSTGGYVFGGYADVAWTSNGQYTASSESFLFALQYPSGVTPVKMPLVQNHHHAVFGQSSYGPTFGSRHDIYVADNASSNSTSYTNLGQTYQLPAGQNAQTFLTGARNFQAAEIEVFRVTS
jgi:hypothetical protein